ncbi:MAG: GGDEF domain-containing phosphodiesterase [Acidimicrobiales bacterium]
MTDAPAAALPDAATVHRRRRARPSRPRADALVALPGALAPVVAGIDASTAVPAPAPEAVRGRRRRLGRALVVAGAVLIIVTAVAAARALGAPAAAVAAVAAVAVVVVAGASIAWIVRARRRRRTVPVPRLRSFDAGANDPVTGLMGRIGLVGALRGHEAGRDRNGIAICFLRLDGLEAINGRLGRTIADGVLRTLAERLHVAAPGDLLARIGASTFVVVRLRSQDAEVLAAALGAVAEPAIVVGGATLHVSTACVVVRTDGFHHDAAVLLDEAERSARPRLRQVRAGYELIELGLAQEVADPERAGVAAALATAVQRGAIVADYQPVVDLRSMEVVGVEALARWRGAPVGFESPGAFLELVEGLGLGPAVLDLILDQVARELTASPAADRGWWVSVNLSTEDCTDPTLPARVAQVLAASGLDPDRLVLEVSERAIPEPGVERALCHLSRLGVRLAIDDFGSGWSSLAQLRSMPLSILKLDRSLVAGPTVQDAQVIMATVALAGALGLETLAEGIEQGEDLLLLCLAECNYGQGFWWSEATTLDDLVARFPALDQEDPEQAFAPVIDMQVVRAAIAAGEPDPDDGPEISDLLEQALRTHGEDRADPLVDFLDERLAGARSAEPADLPGRRPARRLALVDHPVPMTAALDPATVMAWIELDDRDFVDRLRTTFQVPAASSAQVPS